MKDKYYSNPVTCSHTFAFWYILLPDAFSTEIVGSTSMCEAVHFVAHCKALYYTSMCVDMQFDTCLWKMHRNKDARYGSNLGNDQLR